MKIFLSNENKTVEGFININKNNIQEELTKIPNNSCTVIIVQDILEGFAYAAMPQLLQALYSKLRLTGLLSISGIDIQILSRYITNSIIDLAQASELISNMSSVHSLEEISTALSQYSDLEIDTKIKGIKYELYAIRK
jgi:hypothetical protein